MPSANIDEIYDLSITSKSIISFGLGASQNSCGSTMMISLSLSLSISLSRKRSFLSISSHRLTSFTNLRWNAFTFGFNLKEISSKVTIRAIQNMKLLKGKKSAYISKLDDAKFAELSHTRIGRFRLEVDLTQGHILASK